MVSVNVTVTIICVVNIVSMCCEYPSTMIMVYVVTIATVCENDNCDNRVCVTQYGKMLHLCVYDNDNCCSCVYDCGKTLWLCV